jgi:pyrimidine-nucleoside phosphorylase
MQPVGVIAKKRDGFSLHPQEIRQFVDGYAQGTIPDYQMSALAMAIYLRGMNAVETQELTEAMLATGTRLSWNSGGFPKVDKHSTGGLGDKVSLVLAPLLACCDLNVPMISGRGLGSTGGTLDKLESIPGFRTNLTTAEITSLTESIGCVITGTTQDMAPADRKLYALREVTATVASIPLITASIMSKKLAESLDVLVLDVKFGAGAFMKSQADAELLAQSLVETGTRMGVTTTALLTDMSQPLGRMVGNAVEVTEASSALEGHGPHDLWQVVCELGTELLVTATRGNLARDQAELMLSDAISSGRALQKFAEMVQAQGGDLDAKRPISPAHEIVATREGFVTAIQGERIGFAVVDMGGGRRLMSDCVDHSVGLEMLVRIGDQVQRGQPLVRIFARQRNLAVDQAISDAIEIQEVPVTPPLLIAQRITSDAHASQSSTWKGDQDA